MVQALFLKQKGKHLRVWTTYLGIQQPAKALKGSGTGYEGSDLGEGREKVKRILQKDLDPLL